MKLIKGKKTAMVCFAAFMAFMAVCTVAAKGIYASGLPRVTTAKPYSGSLTHVVTVNGTIMQGQEYGIYMEPGLRVDTLSVVNGDTFQAGDPLFRIETGDLSDIIGRRRLEISKLEVQMAEAVREDGRDRQSRRQAAERAKEDYDRKAVLADARIQECYQAYEAARKALALYDQYLIDSSKPVDSGENGGDPPNGDGTGTESESGPDVAGDSGGNAGEPGNTDSDGNLNGDVKNGGMEPDPDDGGAAGGAADSDENGEPEADVGETESTPEAGGNSTEAGEDTGEEDTAGDGISEACRESGGGLYLVSSVAADPEVQYSRREKRFQLEQNVIAAAQALEEAVRQKEDTLRAAARALEDAENAVEISNAGVNTMALDAAYQKDNLQRLEELLEADGWVYAEVSGRVTDSRLEVGGRTQDGAALIYALDDGERIISAVFSEGQDEYVSVGTQFEMKVVMPDGSRAKGTALLEYQEKGADGMVRARLSFDLPGMSIGQSAELTYRMQTENFTTCISKGCVYQEREDSYYVYVAEEQDGILGTEWKVRKVGVRILDQNDTVAAVQSVEIGSDTRIVSSTNKQLTDGSTVRVVQ